MSKAKGEDGEEGPTNFSVRKNIGGRVLPLLNTERTYNPWGALEYAKLPSSSVNKSIFLDKIDKLLLKVLCEGCGTQH